jgi:DNA-binding transcriptional regulator YiaG
LKFNLDLLLKIKTIKPMNEEPTFAERLKAARRKAEITQRELAAMTGVSIACVQAWEQAISEPKPIMQRAILRRLEVCAHENNHHADR